MVVCFSGWLPLLSSYLTFTSLFVKFFGRFSSKKTFSKKFFVDQISVLRIRSNLLVNDGGELISSSIFSPPKKWKVLVHQVIDDDNLDQKKNGQSISPDKRCVRLLHFWLKIILVFFFDKIRIESNQIECLSYYSKWSS